MSNYSDSSIQELNDIEHIQLRPSMYIGALGKPGLYKLDCEPIQNVLDEAMAGYGCRCNIFLNTNENIMTVEDFARGIPIGKLKDIFSKQHVGAKFNNNTYHRHAGANGCGSKVVMALSDWLKCEVYREGYVDEKGVKHPAGYGRVYFENGKCKEYVVEDLPNGIPDGKHPGTTVSYKSSEKYMHTTEHDIPRICDLCNNIAYQTPGFTFNFTVDDKVYTFRHLGGMKEQMKDFIKHKDLNCLFEPIEFQGDESTFDYHIMFTYNPINSGDSNIISYVNGNTTPGHGFHVSSFKKGLGLALTQYISENPTVIPKQFEKLSVTGALLNDNIVAIVGVGHEDPNYDNQMKDTLKSIDVQSPIEKASRNVFLNWLRKNPNQAKKLINLAIDYAKYEFERKKLKKNLIETKAAKSAFGANAIDLSKFTMCRSTDPDKRELFVVEGASAGGQVSEAQDHDFQALYKLRGKLKNVANGSTSNLSKEILDLIQLLGIGFPGTGKLNYDNLQYKSFILLTDADDDGAHIVTLLLAFIYTFYPEMIRRGHVFIANPPIKKITLANKQSFFIHTEKDFEFYMEEFICNTFKLYSEKTGKELSDGLFRTFIRATSGYNNLLDNHASALAIRPDLLERIIVNINIVSQCSENYNDEFNKEFKRISGYDVRKVPNTNLYMFDQGIYHASLRLDKEFLRQHFDVIIEKLYDIHIYGVYLKGIRSNHEYHGTIYQLCEYMNSILGPKIQVTRFKGLGEMSSADLAETVTNPTTRRLTQVTMEYAEQAKRAVKIFMTDADIKFKRLFYAGEVDFA